MRITIGSNISSLKAQRQLSKANSGLTSTFERLASGQRINRASDDAAGLSIADSLNANSRIFNQGVRNLNDGLSLLSIADSAIENLSGIVIRLEELAEQSANGTYGKEQRKAIDAEAQALSKEYFRISKTTKFNGIDLLGGSLGHINLQAGFGDDAVLSAGVGGAIGTGMFQNAISYATEGTQSFSAALGDLNGDGVLDFVAAGDSGTDGFATIRLGVGNGSFGAAVSYTAEDEASFGIALGDLNNDGSLDLVTAGNSDTFEGYATIRLGAGDGSFGAATSYATEGERSRSVTFGDLNGDGVLDLITAGYTSTDEGYATIRLGSGDGTFGAATSFATESAASQAVTLGDLNGDGVLDLVTAGRDGINGYATVRLGHGDGTFGVAQSYLTEDDRSFAVTLGDLNGDGVLDIVTAGKTDSGDGYATIRLGLGDGTFGAAASYATEGMLSRSVAIGDMNGDGVLDLVTAGRDDSPGGYFTLRLGTGDGTFGAARSFSTEARESRVAVLGDINGDGVLDVITAGKNEPNGGWATVRVVSTSDGVAPLLPFSLQTLANARQALPVFKRKREQLATQRGEIGAFQSRIGVAVNVLQISSETSRAAESRIRDVDIATESAELVRQQILQQTAAAVLGQANQGPAIALRLLQT